jgi:hypothetical protein
MTAGARHITTSPALSAAGLLALACAVALAAGCRNRSIRKAANGDAASSDDVSSIDDAGTGGGGSSDAGCPPGSTPCCGQCLGPQAGICAPCLGGDAAADRADDAGGDADGAADAGGVSCGSATCASREYCYSARGGPARQCLARLADGGCPPNSSAGCSYPTSFDGGACQELDIPISSCRALPSQCPSVDPCVCFCGDGIGICIRNGWNILCELP